MRTADRGEGVRGSSCTPTAPDPDKRRRAGIVKAAFCKDVRTEKAKRGLEEWLPAAEMTHPEKRKSLSWTARGGDQSQTVYGEGCPPVFVVGGI